MKRRHDTSAAAKRCTIYLVRHAIAADRGDGWPDDSKRPLTAKGISRMREVARGLRALGVRVDVVVTSPLVRAKQTAEVLVDALKPSQPLALAAGLAPGIAPPQAAEGLDSFRKARRLALVGHEPGLGELAAWLIGASAPLPFKKGGVCRIDVPILPPTRTGQLVWMATPKMLRALGMGN
jgi:phosphohistidine phosphatase